MRFIFICSDESKNAGARDYAMSMAHELRAQGQPTALACKVGDTEHVHLGLKEFIPDNKHYETLPLFDAEKILPKIPEDETCVFIGLGENTLEALCAIHDRLESSQHHFAFVSHILEPSQREVLRTREITAFTPSDIKRHDISHVRIGAVPHTATTPVLKHHATEMLKFGDERIADMINLREEFAIAVLNAGFDVENDLGERIYVPYSEEEAFEHGGILGGMMPKNTNLILVDGGPRNLRDIAEGQHTGDHFLASYYDANGNSDTAPKLVYERFEQGLPYNAVYGAMYLAKASGLSRAFITNAEGYGTMDAAALHIDNSTQILGMFPFMANALDSTGDRLEKIKEYNALGVRLLDVPDYMSDYTPVDANAKTPIIQDDASRIIIDAYRQLDAGANPAPQSPGFS